MIWNLETIREKVRELTGNLSAGALGDDELDDLINSYYQDDFPQEVRLPELDSFYSFNTVAGTKEYDVPADYLIKAPVSINASGIWNGRLEYHLNQEMFFDKYPDDSIDDGTPAAVLIYGQTIYLAPGPDAVYAIEFTAQKRPTALSGDSAIPLVNAWGEIIAYGTAIKMTVSENDSDAASILSGAYKYLLSKISRPYLKQLSQQRSVPSF